MAFLTFIGVDLKENPDLKGDLQKYKKNKSNRDELGIIIEKEIFSDRKLFDEEFEVLLKYLADKCENIRIDVYHLDDWAKDEWCSKVLPLVNSKKMSLIRYQECHDFNKALSYIQKNMPECSKDKVIQAKTDSYFSVILDDHYIITGIPQDIIIIDNNTHIHKMNFYLRIV